jgi:hypothetical protein
VAQLTGQRYLGDYSSDQQQYQGLMDTGITFAQQYGLTPGVALTDSFHAPCNPIPPEPNWHTWITN